MKREYINIAGEFTCEVCKPDAGWFGEAGNENTPFIRIPLVVVQECSQKHRVTVWKGYLSEKAFDNTIRNLVETFPKWDGNLEDLENGKFSFEGMQCDVCTTSESYNGKTMIKASWLNPVGGRKIKQMDKAKVASLVSTLGRKSIAIAGDVKKSLAEKPAETQKDNDEIPF